MNPQTTPPNTGTPESLTGEVAPGDMIGIIGLTIDEYQYLRKLWLGDFK